MYVGLFLLFAQSVTRSVENFPTFCIIWYDEVEKCLN